MGEILQFKQWMLAELVAPQSLWLARYVFQQSELLVAAKWIRGKRAIVKTWQHGVIIYRGLKLKSAATDGRQQAPLYK